MEYTRQTQATLLFLLFGSCCVHAAGPDTLVGTYYYPWYDTTYFNGHYPSGDNTLVNMDDSDDYVQIGYFHLQECYILTIIDLGL